jgi:antiviral helicase SKI2
VFQEKTDNEPVLTPALEQGRDGILAIAERVGRVQDRWQVADISNSNSKSGGGGGGGGNGGLKFGLCEVVWEWARGTSFEEITKLTDVAEGTIVRVITRLDETCREVRDAARVIGDGELFKKMEDAQARIKRDSKYFILFSSLASWKLFSDTFGAVVFAASLYF